MTTNIKSTAMATDTVQAAALTAMTRWYKNNSKDLFVLKGKAGTGKSTLINTFMQRMGLTVDDVLTLATSGIAVQNIKQKTGSTQAKTVAQFLKMPKEEIHVYPVGPYQQGHPVALTAVSSFEMMTGMLANQDAALTTALKSEFKQIKALMRRKTLLAKSTRQTINYNGDADLHLIDVEKFNQLFNCTNPPLFELSTAFIDRDGVQTGTAQGRPRLIVVDELGMVDDETVARLLKVANLDNVPILGAGDDNQLLPVKKPMNAWISAPANQETVVELTEVYRQDKHSYLAVFDSLLSQQLPIKQALTQVGQQAVADGNQIHDIWQNTVTALTQQGPSALADCLLSADAILTFKNADVQKLTQIMRRKKFADLASLDKLPLLHDRVMVTLNENSMVNATDGTQVLNDVRLVNGLTGTIVKMYKKAYMQANLTPREYARYTKLQLRCVDVQFDDRPDVVEKLFINTQFFDNPKVSETMLANYSSTRTYWTQYQVFARNVIQDQQSLFYSERHQSVVFMSFGYVLTVHKAQGREWDNVIYYESGDLWFAEAWRLRYTAATRAVKNLLLLGQ